MINIILNKLFLNVIFGSGLKDIYFAQGHVGGFGQFECWREEC